MALTSSLMGLSFERPTCTEIIMANTMTISMAMKGIPKWESSTPGKNPKKNSRK